VNKPESEAKDKIVHMPKEKIDIAKAIELRLKNGLSYGAIGKQLGCSRGYVHKTLQRFLNILKPPEAVEYYEKFKTQLLSSAEMVILEKIVDTETVAKASLNNAAYAFTALHNAGRLEKGKSTQNVDIRQLTMSLEELQAEQKRLEKELELSND